MSELKKNIKAKIKKCICRIYIECMNEHKTVLSFFKSFQTALNFAKPGIY